MKNKTGAVGEHIAAARKRVGMTQEELAGQLHVTRQTVSNYESMRSQPDIETLVRISECLRVPVEELIYGRQAEKPGRVGGDPLERLCGLLGKLIFAVGFVWGLRAASGARTVGENMVGFAFSPETCLRIWGGALVLGVILLALGRILRMLGAREERE